LELEEEEKQPVYRRLASPIFCFEELGSFVYGKIQCDGVELPRVKIWWLFL
jgi:hypothetical protein